MYFGKTLKLFRTTKGLTQVEVAMSLDITPEYLSKLENDSKIPSMVLLNRISKVLGIPMQLLVFDSLEAEDLPLSKQATFEETKPLLTKLLNLLLIEEDTDYKKVQKLLQELKNLRAKRLQKQKKAS